VAPEPPPSDPLWRRAYDAVDKAVTPRAEEFVRTDTFAVGAALVQRTTSLARGAVRGASARAWHLLNLPAGTEVSRLRAQLGALDREVRRLTIALEQERARAARADGAPDGAPDATPDRPTPLEDARADRAQSTDAARPRAPRRRAQRPPST
jgi:hypothetical protein